MKILGIVTGVIMCILGVLFAVLGLILLFSNLQRFMTDLMIAYLAGTAVIIFGIYQIVNGCRKIKEEKVSSILAIVLGALSVICGIFLLIHPVFTMVSLGYTVACAVLIQGIDTIVLAAKSGRKD